MHETPEIPCQICDLPAHGNHFGAISCRACSAFFRRSIIDKSGESFKCLRGNDKCLLKSSGKFFCKKCRLKKCFEVGMDSKLIQHGRDKIKTPPSLPQTMSTLIGRPSYIIHCSPVANASKKSIVDVTYLIDKANDCFDFGPALLNKQLKILEKMRIANDFLESFENSELSKIEPSSSMTQIPVFDKQFFMHYWEVDFLKTAKWLSFLDGFQKLPRTVQIQILMTTWHLRARMDRLCRTAKLRRKMKIGENDFMIGSNSCFDLKNCKLDVSWCTDYPNEQIQFFLEGSDDWVHNEVVEQLEELNPSEIEISFMTCQFCFHYAGKRLQGYILAEMEKYLDLISDDLHQYYQEQNIKNYSERISKMMKINNRIQKVIWEKRWKTELAQKFDIFHVQFSHPEMFYDCC
ncbi:CRE-NHR-212 protein [Caenorhabditis remanei]|uniref:CRE-NHR-212 protein n=1 Tax=Caenorhabditis remanei TaxID=31234 RepID=E3LLA3_CAERE|nr:CRE-NHR-212 protein [Caenorhabditis remanei]